MAPAARRTWRAGSSLTPPDAFGRGLIAGRAVPCLSARQQRRFRTGYRHRPQDVHDLAQLDALGDQQDLAT
jgi:hypothetical protein